MPMSSAVRRRRRTNSPRPTVPVTIRPVGLRDAAVLLAQRAGLFREIGGISPTKMRSYLPRFGRWFRAEFRAGRVWGFLACDPAGGAVAGGLVWLQPRVPTPRFPHEAAPYIFSVYTEPSHRGRGLASRIVRALVASAARRGYPRVELHATEPGRHVYERLGFEPTNQMRRMLEPRASRTRSTARRRAARSTDAADRTSRSPGGTDARGLSRTRGIHSSRIPRRGIH